MVEKSRLWDLGLQLVKHHRLAAKGRLKMKGMEDWTKEEHEGVADLILEDMRENRWEMLENLYDQVGPFPEKYFGPEIKISLQ